MKRLINHAPPGYRAAATTVVGMLRTAYLMPTRQAPARPFYSHLYRLSEALDWLESTTSSESAAATCWAYVCSHAAHVLLHLDAVRLFMPLAGFSEESHLTCLLLRGEAVDSKKVDANLVQLFYDADGLWLLRTKPAAMVQAIDEFINEHGLELSRLWLDARLKVPFYLHGEDALHEVGYALNLFQQRLG